MSDFSEKCQSRQGLAFYKPVKNMVKIYEYYTRVIQKHSTSLVLLLAAYFQWKLGHNPCTFKFCYVLFMNCHLVVSFKKKIAWIVCSQKQDIICRKRTHPLIIPIFYMKYRAVLGPDDSVFLRDNSFLFNFACANFNFTKIEKLLWFKGNLNFITLSLEFERLCVTIWPKNSKNISFVKPILFPLQLYPTRIFWSRNVFLATLRMTIWSSAEIW